MTVMIITMITLFGIDGRYDPLKRPINLLSVIMICAPPVIIRTIPRKAVMVAIVVINVGILRKV